MKKILIYGQSGPLVSARNWKQLLPDFSVVIVNSPKLFFEVVDATQFSGGGFTATVAVLQSKAKALIALRGLQKKCPTWKTGLLVAVGKDPVRQRKNSRTGLIFVPARDCLPGTLLSLILTELEQRPLRQPQQIKV